MRPQLQRHLGGDGEHGDCHRTCVAMVLNMARDEVPHFMHDLPPGTPADDPRSVECLRREREWLAGHGLGPVCVPFPGATDVLHLLESIEVMAHDCPIVLGCSSPNGDHSVVIHAGAIYNPSNGTIVGPMRDGFWWLTIYSVGPGWVSRAAARELAFRDGWSACVEVVARGENPASQQCEDALARRLQPDADQASVAPQEAS